MGCNKQLFVPLPYPVITDLPSDPTPLIERPEVHQLKIDVLNVVEGRVDINTFEKEYQDKILNFYRFSGTAYTTKNPVCAKRTTNTLDII